VHVLESDTPLDELVPLAAGRAAAAIALYLLTERDAAQLSEAAEHSLIQDLAQGRGFSGEDFLARATGLGLDFEAELAILVAAPHPARPGADARTDGAATVKAFREAMRAANWPSLVASLDGLVVAVVSATPPGGLRVAATHVMEELHESATPILQIGVSRPTKVPMLPRAFAEAEVAHRLGPKTDAGAMHHYDDLVLYRLLAPLLSGPELANFVESELGGLIAHDESHNSELIATLDAYLQSNGSKAAAAQLLHLQRRSVYYRLTRIEELLGRDIDTPSNRARLFLALRAREMLDARPLITGTPDIPNGHAGG
jgi:purine catabolism regulator